MILTHRSYVSVDEVAELAEQDVAARAADNAGYDPLAGVPEQYRGGLAELDVAEPPALDGAQGVERDAALKAAFDEGEYALVRYDMPADQHEDGLDTEEVTLYALCEMRLATQHRGQDRVVVPSPERVDAADAAYKQVLADFDA